MGRPVLLDFTTTINKADAISFPDEFHSKTKIKSIIIGTTQTAHNIWVFRGQTNISYIFWGPKQIWI